LCVHRSGEELDINKIVTSEDGVKVGVLGQVDGAGVAVVHDLDAEHPVKLTEVSDLDMAAESSFKVFNKMLRAGSDGAVVDVHCDNDKLLDLRQVLVEHSLVDS
jgi:hypothetical protein